MSDSSDPGGHGLRVVQCFRAPLGGLFRHVCDLTHGLAERGAEIAIVCDKADRSDLDRDRLDALRPACVHGIHRFAMPRAPGYADFAAAASVARIASEIGADIIHGHGAKGGAYARLAAPFTGARPVYTPHGGSLNYSGSTVGRLVFQGAEKMLRYFGGTIIFESGFAAEAYAAWVGAPPRDARIIHNGVAEREFAPVAPADAQVDILYIGELRQAKGIDVLVDALAAIAARRTVSALIVGSGPQEAATRARIAALGLEGSVAMSPPMPAREAFARARMMAVPSLAESLPYIVLEAGAAGLPMVATNVGGIPEIFGDEAGLLIEPGDPEPLAAAIEAVLANPYRARAAAGRLRARIAAEFSVERMVDAIVEVYRSLLAPQRVTPALPAPGRSG